MAARCRDAGHQTARAPRHWRPHHEPRAHGRTAIVTGASRGIGLAIAEALLDAGANVVLTSRTQEAAKPAASALGSERAVGYGAHATDEEAAAACVEFALERFGGVDILVNNAGTNPAFGPVVNQDHARFVKTMDVNVWAPVLWTQLAWRSWMPDTAERSSTPRRSAAWR